MEEQAKYVNIKKDYNLLNELPEVRNKISVDAKTGLFHFHWQIN